MAAEARAEPDPIALRRRNLRSAMREMGRTRRVGGGRRIERRMFFFLFSRSISGRIPTDFLLLCVYADNAHSVNAKSDGSVTLKTS